MLPENNSVVVQIKDNQGCGESAPHILKRIVMGERVGTLVGDASHGE